MVQQQGACSCLEEQGIHHTPDCPHHVVGNMQLDRCWQTCRQRLPAFGALQLPCRWQLSAGAWTISTHGGSCLGGRVRVGDIAGERALVCELPAQANGCQLLLAAAAVRLLLRLRGGRPHRLQRSHVL